MVRGCVDSAKREGARSGRTAVQVLEAIIDGQFTSVAKNGRTVISTSEAGGSATFHIDSGLGPQGVIDLAIEAKDFIESQSDPVNPVTTNRRIVRLRASFSKADLT